MSWGYYGCEYDSVPEGDFAELKAAVHQAYQSGLTLIAAAGNLWQKPPSCPASYQGVVGVAGTDTSDACQMLLSRGYHVDCAAPYFSITTDTCGYCVQAGTSIAAPQVSGVAGLLQSRAYSRFGEFLYGEDVCGLICGSTDPASSPEESYPNIYVGWGRVNAAKALARLDEPYNEGEGPELFSTSGVDAYACDTSYVFEPGSKVAYHRYRCLKWGEYGGCYDDFFAWGMDRFETNGGPPFPGDSTEIHWPYCSVIPDSMLGWRCCLKSFVYMRVDSVAATEAWLPCPPESLRWSYRVSGEYSSSVDTSVGQSRTGSTLLVNYPNPFNPSTTISLSLEQEQPIGLRIYDVSGRLVRTLAVGRLRAGNHAFAWDGEDDSGVPVGAGIYVCLLQTRNGSERRKLVLIR